MKRAPFLSVEGVREIFLSDEPVKVLAHRYHTGYGTISRIRNGEQHAAVTRALILNAALISIAASPTNSTTH